jgi:hypothetical protein
VRWPGNFELGALEVSLLVLLAAFLFILFGCAMF